jgi:phosphoglycolate phosphatase-like HAD superfamily hydrolase
VGTSEPAPAVVHVALRAGARPQQAVFAGDTVWDATACQWAGVACIGLRRGGICVEALVSAGASAVFAGPAGLLEATAGRRAAALPARLPS